MNFTEIVRWGRLTTRTHEDCSTSRIHFGVVDQLPETSAITTRPPHRGIFQNEIWYRYILLRLLISEFKPKLQQAHGSILIRARLSHHNRWETKHASMEVRVSMERCLTVKKQIYHARGEGLGKKYRRHQSLRDLICISFRR